MKIFKRNTGDIDDEYDDLNRFLTISNCEDDDMTSKEYLLVTNAAVSASFLEAKLVKRARNACTQGNMVRIK